MNNQFCKVGAVKAITNETHSITIIEELYQYFIEKSSHMNYVNTKKGAFFLAKAIKFNKILKELYV